MTQKRIRWLKRDNIEFAKIRKNFNAKIERLKAAGYPEEFIPDKLYLKDVKKLTRSDYNKIKKFGNDFLTRGSEEMTTYKGIEMPKFKKKDVLRKVNSVSQKVKKELEQFSYEKGNTTQKMKQNLFTPDEFVSTKKLLNYLDRKYYDYLTVEDLNRYKNNYLNGIIKNFGYNTELYDYINSLSSQQVYDKLHDGGDYSISFLYNIADNIQAYDRLLSEWIGDSTIKNKGEHE